MMKPSAFRGASSIVCPGCSGTWISGDALHELFSNDNNLPIFLERFEALFDLDFDEGSSTCPSCVSQKLKAVNIDNTEIDFCPSCKGLFFDKGELEEVFSGEFEMIDNRSTVAAANTEESFWETLLGFIGDARKTR